MAKRQAGVRGDNRGVGKGEGDEDGGSVAESHSGATSEGKNTYVEVRWSRGWRRSSAVDGDGGKVGKKCGESGLDRYPGVGHLLDPRR